MSQRVEWDKQSLEVPRRPGVNSQTLGTESFTLSEFAFAGSSP